MECLPEFGPLGSARFGHCIDSGSKQLDGSDGLTSHRHVADSTAVCHGAGLRFTYQARREKSKPRGWFPVKTPTPTPTLRDRPHPTTPWQPQSHQPITRSRGVASLRNAQSATGAPRERAAEMRSRELDEQSSMRKHANVEPLRRAREEVHKRAFPRRSM